MLGGPGILHQGFGPNHTARLYIDAGKGRQPSAAVSTGSPAEESEKKGGPAISNIRDGFMGWVMITYTVLITT